MFKRIGVLLLAILLVLGNFTSASAMGKNLPQKAQKKENLVSEKLNETADPDEELRVIVELKDEAPIIKATKKGVKYDKLSKTEKKQLEKEARAKQKAVKDEMKGKKIKSKHLQEFTTVVNGFSVEVKQGDLELIKQIPNVKSVTVVTEYERPVVEPEMKYSKELVEAQKAWRDFGYKGEGMVVGIIDTGIDPSHRDMVLTDNESGKLTEALVNETIADEELPGLYYTEKVPYGYNYMDENHEIREIHSKASMHGMHVAGTVGANGDEDNGGILGIAPEAQLLALKVFGNDPEMQSTYGDIYVKAIDDAVKLGVDVLNMSLGSPAGFVDPEAAEQQAVKRAVDNGVLMSISAGNSALFADGYYYPLATNPDYGVNGSPGVSYESLQVASFENSFMEAEAVEYAIDGEPGVAPFLSAGNTSPPTDGSTFEVLHAGLGNPADFQGKDFNGKYALVQRGEIGFVDKALNAQAAGAAGVFIYNNADGLVNMATEPEIVIPQLFMLKNDGDRLAAALKNGQAVTITFAGGSSKIDNPSAGEMSDFTSWGLTPNLDFKPEITAPGGQILSTLNDDQYGMMSGTSMAAPHVAGGGALVLQRVDEEFGLVNSERVLQAKNIMMNTAKLVEFDDAFVSPRRQGAGLMQLHAALSTPVIVTEAQTNEAKVALKQINENQVTFELTAENFTDESVTYEVEANVQTDAPVNAGSEFVVAPNMFGALDLEGMATATINGEEVSTVEVPANGTATISVTVDVSDVDAMLKSYFENGYWLEGFVTLTDPTDTNPQLSVPYVGFKGEWDSAPIIDTPMWDQDTYYGMTGVVTSAGRPGSYDFLGEDLNTGEIDPAKIAFSPNGNGVQDDALIILSFLRNAKEAKFNVLDENKKVVRTIKTETDVRKNYYDGGRAPMYSLNGSRAWDGKINGRVAPDGQYYLQVEAVIDFDGAKSQTLTVPVILDTVAPELEATLDEATQAITVDASDEGSGLAYWDVLVDGKSILSKPYTKGETEHQLTKAVNPDQALTVVAVDYAGNSVEKEVAEGEDVTVPDLHLLTPEFLGVESGSQVVFSGYVKDKSGVKEVTIDGKKVNLTYNTEKDKYEFSHKVTYKKDGYYLAKIKAVDNAGNETEIGRRFFVDTEKAKLNVKVKGPKKVETDTITVEADIKDNFDEITLYVNGNEIYTNELSSPYGMNGFKETIKNIELELEDGVNKFEFEVVDLGGHVTKETIVIEKQVKKNNGNGKK